MFVLIFFPIIITVQINFLFFTLSFPVCLKTANLFPLFFLFFLRSLFYPQIWKRILSLCGPNSCKSLINRLWNIPVQHSGKTHMCYFFLISNLNTSDGESILQAGSQNKPWRRDWKFSMIIASRSPKIFTQLYFCFLLSSFLF